MNKKRVLFVLGTRPEGIKLAPLYLQMIQHDEFEVRLCSTGQHREMLDQVMNFFSITPDYELNVMKKNQTLSGVTQAILEGLDPVIEEFQPHVIVVQGDTTTVFTGALAAFYKGVKIAHVEAGLRTWNILNPFPEEANRVLVSRLADIHLAPTEAAVDNLLKDNVVKENVYMVGNTVTDAVILARELVAQKDNLISQKFSDVNLDKKIILLTSHRRENLGEGLNNICEAVASIADREDVEFVFPVHLNPRVKDVVHSKLAGRANIHLIEPLDYPDLVWIMSRCYMVMTDSGGIQEEAPSLGKPVLVMRETTERPEGVQAGTAKLVGTNKTLMVEVATSLLDNVDGIYDQMAQAINPYGDGKCSQRIVDIISNKIQT